jgi:hypothetical protein
MDIVRQPVSECSRVNDATELAAGTTHSAPARTSLQRMGNITADMKAFVYTQR